MFTFVKGAIASSISRMGSSLFVPYADLVAVFDRDSAQDYTDVSGYHHPTTLGGTPVGIVVGGGVDGRNGYQNGPVGGSSGLNQGFHFTYDEGLRPLNKPFTAEVWINIQELVGYQPVLGCLGGGDANGCVLDISASNNFGILRSSGGGWTSYNENMVAATVGLHHLVLQRDAAGNWDMFLDGACYNLDNSGTSWSVGGDTLGWALGMYPYYPGGSRVSSAIFSDFQLTLGEAKYAHMTPNGTVSFTPSNAQPRGFRNDCSMLMRFHGPDAGTVFQDESPNATQLTYNGTAALVNQPGSLVGSKTGYATFVGGGQIVPSSGFHAMCEGVMHLENEDFTYEIDVYWLGNNGTYQVLFNTRSSDGSGTAFSWQLNGGNDMQWQVGGPFQIQVDVTSLLPANEWCKLCAMRKENVVYLMINGVPIPGATWADNRAYSDGEFHLGGYYANNDYPWNGYMKEFRCTKSALYPVTGYTPSATIEPLLTTDDVVLHFDGVDGASQIVDSSTNNYPMVNTGAQLSATQSVFGSTSLKCTGNGVYLTAPENFDFSGDFTVHGWFNWDGSGGYNNIWAIQIGLAPGNRDSHPVINMYVNGGNITIHGNSADLFDVGGISSNTEYHYAFVRSAGVGKLYINGTQVGSSFADTNDYSAPCFAVGTDSTGNDNAFHGYMDEVHMATSALWTANFTPPLRATIE